MSDYRCSRGGFTISNRRFPRGPVRIYRPIGGSRQRIEKTRSRPDRDSIKKDDQESKKALERERRRLIRDKAIQKEKDEKRRKRQKQTKDNQIRRKVQLRPNRRIRVSKANCNQLFQPYIANADIPISNDIGIGILSYNRLNSLKRLIESIEAHTDINSTTVFVSDESDKSHKDKIVEYLNSKKWITVLDNKERLGIAGNSNRLLRCLQRFKNKILLNDDVEIIADNWDRFYVDAMKSSGLHHICFRQIGIYGARGDHETNGRIRTIHQKPQGAVMVFDDAAFNKVGYFDTRFGIYGMEHVDWSTRVSTSGIQKKGFHDIVGSEKYIKVHGEKSAVEKRVEKLNKAKSVYKGIDKSRTYVGPDNRSAVPSVTYVIPCRVTNDRKYPIFNVIANVKSQSFPCIEIILVEQDECARFSPGELEPAKHMYAGQSPKGLFSKSMAFNTGVCASNNRKIVLHDADMLVERSYTSFVDDILDRFESCHVGRNVFYLDQNSTNRILQGHRDQLNCNRIAGYFEGGSLAVHRDVYDRVGGFCEEFEGYGAEDCEFFERLGENSNMFNTRTIDLIHLYHGRAQNWDNHHNDNKDTWARLQSLSMDNRLERCQNNLKKYIK